MAWFVRKSLGPLRLNPNQRGVGAGSGSTGRLVAGRNRPAGSLKGMGMMTFGEIAHPRDSDRMGTNGRADHRVASLPCLLRSGRAGSTGASLFGLQGKRPALPGH